MNFYKHNFLLLAFAAAAVSSCKDADPVNEHHFNNRLYVSSQPVCDDLLIKDNQSETSREISYRIASPIEKDIQINLEAVPSLTAAYNLFYNDNATALDSRYYDIPEKTVMIRAGSILSNDIAINFKNTDELDKSRRYVLPVTILNASNIDVLESRRTAYFIFKGAALINVVANIRKIYFPVQWQSEVGNLSTVTIEALLRSEDWEDGRDNPLSSIFGIEGSFLIRIGDSDRPRDQLQLDGPGGKFPAPNKAPGLPVNEWIHIAIVYDATTGERLYYQNGELVASDNGATSSISLSDNCYIGKSFDNNRWLPGEIAELRIWNVQRTAAQIAKYPYNVNPASEGLIAYWKFNEGVGAQITDQTEHGNDITAEGGTPTWINVEIPAVEK